MKPDVKAIRARADDRTCGPKYAMESASDVPALCDRIEALEAALCAVLKWLPADSRGAAQIRAALEGES